MGKITISFLVGFWLSSGYALAQDAYPIRGYSLGQRITACPEGSIVKKLTLVTTMCTMKLDSYAGVKASSISIVFNNQRIYQVFLRLDGNRNENYAIVSALEMRFGPPARVIRNEIFQWYRLDNKEGERGLVLNLEAGKLESLDVDLLNTAIKDAALAAQKDM